MQHYKTLCGATVSATVTDHGSYNNIVFYDNDGHPVSFCPGCGNIVTEWTRTGEYGKFEIDTDKLVEIPAPELPPDQAMRRAGMPGLPGVN